MWAMGVALGSVWMMYGFDIGPLHRFDNLPVPFPLHWEGVLFQVDEVGSRTAFAMGYLKEGENWWWYFPLAFLLKNPLPLLIGVALSFYSWYPLVLGSKLLMPFL